MSRDAQIDARRKKTRPNFVYAWRKARQLTQEQLAERAGVSASMISLIENGGSGFTVETLSDIGHALRVRPGWLLDRDPKAIEDILSIAEDIEELPPELRERLLKAAKVLAGI